MKTKTTKVILQNIYTNKDENNEKKKIVVH